MSKSPSTAGSLSMTVLDQGVAKGDQDVVAFRILAHEGQVLRFTARSDAYEKQCSAKIEHWNPVQGGWSLLHSLPHGLMQTPLKLKYDANGAQWLHFEKDFQRLFKTASAVLAVVHGAPSVEKDPDPVAPGSSKPARSRSVR